MGACEPHCEQSSRPAYTLSSPWPVVVSGKGSLLAVGTSGSGCSGETCPHYSIYSETRYLSKVSGFFLSTGYPLWRCYNSELFTAYAQVIHRSELSTDCYPHIHSIFTGYPQVAECRGVWRFCNKYPSNAYGQSLCSPKRCYNTCLHTQRSSYA